MNALKRIGMAGLAAAALSWSASSALAIDEIVIGVVDDLSALVAEAGNDSLNGVKVAVEEANAAGGVNGKKIKLVVYDGKVDPQLTSTYVTRLIEDDEAVALFGGNVSGAVPGTITDLERLQQLYELFAEVLDRLSETGSAYTRDPGVAL